MDRVRSSAFVTLRMLVSRRWLMATILVIVGMGVLVRLGFWQLDRLEQRRAQNAELKQALESPAFVLNERPNLWNELPDMKDREVTVQGQFDYSEQITLKLQSWRGRPGVHLVAPLQMEGIESAVLVDRGWIPDAESSPQEQSQYDEPGPITVSGYIGLTQTLSRSGPADNLASGHQQEWYRIDIEAIQSQIQYPLLPVYIVQAPSPGGDAEPPFRPEREIDLSEGSHLGYAIQWFTFSLMLGVGYFAYVGKKGRPERTT